MAKQRLFQNERSFLRDMWDDERPFAVIIWVLCWWFLIPYFVFKWSYKYIYVPIDDKKEMEQLQEVAAEEKVKAKDELELLAQQLRDAAPTTPPDKMRATILLNTIERPTGTFRHSVDMMVELPEAERAIIYQHQLDFIEVENVLRSKDQLALMRRDRHEELDAISELKNPLSKAITRQLNQNADQLQKEERLKTTVGDLLVVPYQRLFDTAHEAKEHSDKLKTELLPQVRKLIDGYKTYNAAETVEF